MQCNEKLSCVASTGADFADSEIRDGSHVNWSVVLYRRGFLNPEGPAGYAEIVGMDSSSLWIAISFLSHKFFNGYVEQHR